MVNNNYNDRNVFYRQVLMLVLPMALQNLINVAVTSADVVMLGRVGETVLSASSLAGQVQFVMTLFFFGLTSGAAVLTAQYWGKGDTKVIEHILGISLRFSVGISLLFTAAVLLFPAFVMRIFTPDEAVVAEGVKYLRIVALSYLFMGFTNIYLNIMRSVERVIISTVVYLISFFVNVLLNAVFIFGLLGFPAMGISGAALATLIARAVELVIVSVYAKRNPVIHFRIRDVFVKDHLIFLDFLRYSLPVTANELMWGLGCSMNAVVIGHLGSAAVAANSVAQVARQLATVIAFGIANAAAIMIGKAIGENNPERAMDYSRRFVRLTLLAGFGGAAVILIVRPILPHFLNLSAESQGYLSFMMFVMSYFVIGQAFNTTMVVGIFRSGGDTKFGLALDISTMWGCSILFGAVCAFLLHWPVPAVYMVLMSDEIIKIPLTAVHYRKRTWLRNVTR